MYSIDLDRFNKLKNIVKDKRVERKLLRSGIRESKVSIKKFEVQYETACKTRKWVQTVAAKTQEQISSSIGDLVTKSMSSVFADPYQFKVRFVPRRNKTECDLLFHRDGFDVDPIDASGGGAVDIASFALRATFWMLDDSTRPIIILDEPFKFVSADLQPYCGNMLKSMSDDLGVQIVMVSHLPDIIRSADNIIEISNQNGVSVIT